MYSLIKVNDVKFCYNDVIEILNDLNLEIDSGDFVSIVGSNGCGKSTLVKMFNALIIPKSGDVFVAEINTKNSDLIFEIRKKVGMVFQNPDSQIVATLVEEDVAFAMENLCLPQEKMESKIVEVLKLVDMENYKTKSVNNLSGGQKQRIAIAGVLAMEPRCIIFDEATAMLDPDGRKKILKIMKTLNENSNTTIVNITHNMEEVAISKTVVVLHEGKVIKKSTPLEFFSDEVVLKKANLKCLEVTELIKKLANEGLIKKQIVLNIDECVEIIAQLLKGNM